MQFRPTSSLIWKCFGKLAWLTALLSPPTSGRTLESFLSKTTSRHFTNIFTFAPDHKVTFFKDFFSSLIFYSLFLYFLILERDQCKTRLCVGAVVFSQRLNWIPFLQWCSMFYWCNNLPPVAKPIWKSSVSASPNSQSSVLCGLWHCDLRDVSFLKFIHSGHIHTRLTFGMWAEF